MSIWGVSSISFWQQDQNFQTQQQNLDQQLSAMNSSANTMISALTSLSSGMASTVNQQALTRVSTQLQAAEAAAQSGSTNSPSVFSGTSGLTNYAANLLSSDTASLLSSELSNNSSSGTVLDLLV